MGICAVTGDEVWFRYPETELDAEGAAINGKEGLMQTVTVMPFVDKGDAVMAVELVNRVESYRVTEETSKSSRTSSPAGKPSGFAGAPLQREEAERRRIESLESIAELSASGNSVAAEALAQRSVMDFRIARLSLCVEGFAGLRDSLDLRDILEIETFCAKLSSRKSQRETETLVALGGDAGRAQYLHGLRPALPETRKNGVLPDLRQARAAPA